MPFLEGSSVGKTLKTHGKVITVIKNLAHKRRWTLGSINNRFDTLS